MSYRCENCGEHQMPRTRPNLVVTKFRPTAGFGWQIVTEAKFCEKCYANVVVMAPPSRMVQEEQRDARLAVSMGDGIHEALGRDPRRAQA